MKKLFLVIALCFSTMLIFNSCKNSTEDNHVGYIGDGVKISLSDDGISVDGNTASEDLLSDVYVANDIVYYPEGKDFTFGEGTAEDEHPESEANKHTVVHITKPGTYILSGKLSFGQVAIDLGNDAKEDPSAKVTLVLNGVDITSTVAPAVIFYNVYECGNKDEAAASKDVDTTGAGANVIIADGTVNNIAGSCVARIYKSVELSEDGTKVLDNKKLHKYDAAFYSKMTMNINGDAKGTGVLNIEAENEGLDSELHLTINGGNINIVSGNDGINTNEDNVSVTTLNGGSLNVVVNGSTGEGDGIDSNGWLVINGGTLTSAAYSYSMDSGIDSDKGIHINGGDVMATGNMLDRISESDATYVVFSFFSSQSGGLVYTLKNEKGEVVKQWTPANDFTNLIVSSDKIVPGTYTLWVDDTQLALSMSGGMAGGRPGGNMRPNGMGGGRPEGTMPDFGDGQFPQMPDFADGQFPQMPDFADGQFPQMPDFADGQMPEFDMSQMPEMPMGERGQLPDFQGRENGNMPEMPKFEDGEMPDSFEFENGKLPEGFDFKSGEKDGFTQDHKIRPENSDRPVRPEGEITMSFDVTKGDRQQGYTGANNNESISEFVINPGGNYFSVTGTV